MRILMRYHHAHAYIRWMAPSALTTVTHYAVYLAAEHDGSGTKRQLGSDMAVSEGGGEGGGEGGSEEMQVETGTSTAGMRFIVVYTKTADALEADPASIFLVDLVDGPPSVLIAVLWVVAFSACASTWACRAHLRCCATSQRKSLWAQQSLMVTEACTVD